MRAAASTPSPTPVWSIPRLERAFGSFARSLTLPEGVNPDAVRASFDQGVLEERIPKSEERKPRKVAISVGGGAQEPKTIEGTESSTS
jgi:HSP20 family protein